MDWTLLSRPDDSAVQVPELSAAQGLTDTLVYKADTRTRDNPTPRTRSPSVLGSPLLLYWPDKRIPVPTPAQCICSSIQHLAPFSLKSPLMLLPGKTLSGRSVPVTTAAERSDYFANFTGEHVKLLSPWNSVSWLADLPMLQTKNARLPGHSTDSQHLINNF